MSSTYTVVAYQGKDLPKEYEPYVFSKWLRSLRYGNDYYHLIRANAYYPVYHRYINHILHKLNATVRFAVLTEDPDVLLGFSVSRGTILDYVFVHKNGRRKGIAKSLVPANIDTITHLTKTGLNIWGSKYPGWSFNPFA